MSKNRNIYEVENPIPHNVQTLTFLQMKEIVEGLSMVFDLSNRGIDDTQIHNGVKDLQDRIATLMEDN